MSLDRDNLRGNPVKKKKSFGNHKFDRDGIYFKHFLTTFKFLLNFNQVELFR